MPMRRRLPILVVLVVLLALQGVSCISGEPPVSSAFDPMAEFPAQATYVWDEAGNVLPNDLSVRQLEIGPLIQQLATEALAEHGYTVAQSGTPPYRVSYELMIHTWISEQRSTSTASLALRMADYLSNQTVWKGFTRIEVRLGRSEEERTALLRKTFARMLENFPPSER